jgi:cytochrome d ubiquinol oxidase subunit I
VIACFLTTAFVVAGVSAWHLLKQRAVPHARIGLSMALGLIAVLAPAQLVLGDLHGLNTLEHQPAKVAAMEGHWETRAGAPLVLFALPDQEAATNHYEIAIPKLGSLILTHDPDGVVQGLSEWAPEDRPYVPIVFWSFRLMVGIGLIMIGMGLISLLLRRGGRLYVTRWFLRACVACVPIGFIALLAGWVTTEVGRQPWVIYGLLRTVDAVSPAVTAGAVATSLAAFVIVYAMIFPAGVYYMVRLIQRGPGQIEGPTPPMPPELQTAKRPLSAAGPLPEGAE